MKAFLLIIAIAVVASLVLHELVPQWIPVIQIIKGVIAIICLLIIANLDKITKYMIGRKVS